MYETHKNILSTLLAQEVIPGPDTASWVCSCTFDRSHRLLDCSIKQKLRMAPPHFGISTLAVSRSNDAIVELVRKLGAGLAYKGHAGIEFRWDSRDETYKYIELNPRIPANVEFDEATRLPTVWNSYRVAIGPGHAAGTAQGSVFRLRRSDAGRRGGRAVLEADRARPVAPFARRGGRVNFPVIRDTRIGAVPQP